MSPHTLPQTLLPYAVELLLEIDEIEVTRLVVFNVFFSDLPDSEELVYRSSAWSETREVGNREGTRGQNPIEEAVINNFSPRVSFLLQSLYSQQRHLAARVVNYAKT